MVVVEGSKTSSPGVNIREGGGSGDGGAMNAGGGSRSDSVTVMAGGVAGGVDYDG